MSLATRVRFTLARRLDRNFLRLETGEGGHRRFVGGVSTALGRGDLLVAGEAHAYIGPGAGFAVLGSFAVIFVTMILAGISILAWPFRTVWRMIRHRRKSKPLVKRTIFIGFDGQDAKITERMMAVRSPPSRLPTKSQFLRPTAIRLKARSASLLSIGRRPSLTYNCKASH